MKNLVLVGLSALLSVPAFANHWNFECPAGGGRTYKVLINNKKAKLVTTSGKVVFAFSKKGQRKVYKGGANGESMLLAPNVNFTLNQIPMGYAATFTYEVPGPNEALVLECETRPTWSRDPDLN